MKNTEFTINTKKRNLIIALMIVMIATMAGIFVGCSAHNKVNNSDSEVIVDATSEPTEEPTSTPEVTPNPTEKPEATVEPTEEPTSTPEVTEEPTSAPTEEPKPEEPKPTEKPEETPQPSEPTPQPETPKPEEPKPHTHSYTSSVTQPTCTTQGYTTYTCACGDSYKDNYVNGSHNYSNGTCTACGASDPNYVPPHTHSWVDKTWTEDVVSEERVEVFVCDCNIEWSTIDALSAHQDAVPQCGGWNNTYKWIETITQIIHHYRECACGAREDID